MDDDTTIDYMKGPYTCIYIAWKPRDPSLEVARRTRVVPVDY
jgi:hypothetical protein